VEEEEKLHEGKVLSVFVECCLLYANYYVNNSVAINHFLLLLILLAIRIKYIL
jgi:hypothetical protein